MPNSGGRNYKPMSDTVIQRILASNPPRAETTEIVAKEPAKPVPVAPVFAQRPLDEAYDTLHPVEAIRTFVQFLKDAQSRFNGNYAEIGELEKKTTDLLHYIELAPNMGAKDGFEAYRAVRDVCVERRKLKDENRILDPMNRFLTDYPKIIEQLERLQGYCTQQKDAVARQAYQPRTDVLETLYSDEGMEANPC